MNVFVSISVSTELRLAGFIVELGCYYLCSASVVDQLILTKEGQARIARSPRKSPIILTDPP
jgi:hypothetical protein